VLGRALIQKVLSQQLNGAFDEYGGFDSAYQSVSLVFLEQLYTMALSRAIHRL
jgi:hypothetical protein